MSEKKKIIITIARQYGSGGADTGKKLAEDLGISFYDKNILRMNSDESGIKESYFHLADEKAGNRLLYKIINTLTPEKGAPSFGSDLISADNLFRFQSEVIRKLAAEESCVIIGRSANYLLQDRDDLINIFIYAPEEDRIRAIMENQSVSEKKAREIVSYNDEKNRSRHQYITGTNRGDRSQRDLLINSSLLGWEKTCQYLLMLVEMLNE